MRAEAAARGAPANDSKRRRSTARAAKLRAGAAAPRKLRRPRPAVRDDGVASRGCIAMPRPSRRAAGRRRPLPPVVEAVDENEAAVTMLQAAERRARARRSCFSAAPPSVVRPRGRDAPALSCFAAPRAKQELSLDGCSATLGDAQRCCTPTCGARGPRRRRRRSAQRSPAPTTAWPPAPPPSGDGGRERFEMNERRQKRDDGGQRRHRAPKDDGPARHATTTPSARRLRRHAGWNSLAARPHGPRRGRRKDS